MGEVFRAYDTQTEREVAIKILPSRTLQGHWLERFKLEARTIARIEHPFVVPLYDYSLPDNDEQPFLVMRYMRGGTLADKIKQGRLHSNEVAQITRRIAAALDAAHERGLVHRDLKPSNILLDQDGYSYLADFGIVKDMTADGSFTQGGQPGTAHYMSPEQITGRMIDGRSDIYSLGVLAFEMLTGVKPFQGNLNTIFQAHIYEKVPGVHNYVDHIPDEVDDVLRQAMAKNPDDRFAKASHMAHELEAALQSPLAYMRARSALESGEAVTPFVSQISNAREGPEDGRNRNNFPSLEELSSGIQSYDLEKNTSANYLNYPLDHIPSPQPLPPYSRISFRHHPSFINREKEMQTLAQQLKEGQAVIITGLGGAGKTQLSVEFAHRYGHYFIGGVFWLNFAEVENIPAEVAACGGAEGLNLIPKFDRLDLNDQVRLVQQIWQQPIPRLLIFDNCEDKTLLEKWWPTTGGCRVIVTSRQNRWSRVRNIANLTLDTLPMVDSVSLLQKYIPDSSDDEAEAIAAELGNLPLALHLAGSFLERYHSVVSPKDYFDQLKKQGLKHPSLTGRGVQYSPTEHELHVARTFALSHEKLDATNEIDFVALALLSRAACFAPGEPIPRKLLFATLSFNKDDLEAALLAEDGLARLQDLGLAMLTENGSVWLHRLVAKFGQQASTETNAQDDVEVTLWQKAKNLNQRLMPSAFKDWQSHLRYVAGQAQDQNSERAADLSHEFGNYLRLASNYEEALVWLERAWQLRGHRLGPEHLETARSLNDMGIVQAEMGQLDDALSTVREALNIRQQFSAIHGDTAESYNNLGHILQSLGDLAGAHQEIEHSLAIYEQLSDLVPHEKAQSLNNLGVVLMKLGEVDKSQIYLEQARDIWQNHLDPNHAYIAHVMINLGTIAWSSGDLPQAKQYFEQGVDVLKASLGERHPLAATAYNNLGATFRELGNFEEAQLNLDRALSIFQDMEPGGTNQANTLRNLGLLYQKRQELKQAKELFEQARTTLEKWQNSHNVKHPLTEVVASHLAALTETTDDQLN